MLLKKSLPPTDSFNDSPLTQSDSRQRHALLGIRAHSETLPHMDADKQSIPIDLTAFVLRGANIGGINVKKITVELEDGRTVTLDLPLPQAEKPLNGMQEAIYECLTQDMPAGETWSYQHIADVSGYANSGHLRAYVKEIAPGLGLTIGNRGLMKPLNT